MPFLRRHVARLGWFRRFAKVYLQIQDERDGKWRDANAQDLAIWEEEQKNAQKRDRSKITTRSGTNGFFPIGVRVRITERSGFSKGSHGVVQFQEPNEGRVWVLRDGADGPSFFYGHELAYEDRTFTRPQQIALRWNDESMRMWWIAIGALKIDNRSALEWCEENGLSGYVLLASDYDHDSIYLAGFDNEGDAMLFYMRFL